MKMNKKSQNLYLADQKLLIAQNSWQFRYRILLTILLETIHKIKCKNEDHNKICETCGIKYKNCQYFLEYTNLKEGLINYKGLCCNKNYQNRFDKNLKNLKNIPTMILTRLS